MKYSITYTRKIQVKQYEPLTISYTQEFDETTEPDGAFYLVSKKVNHWIHQERERLLKEEAS